MFEGMGKCSENNIKWEEQYSKIYTIPIQQKKE